MGDRTGIIWSEATWNPIAGCSVASPGCTNCYAARDAAGRLSGHPVYAGLAARPEGGGAATFTGEVRLLPERLDQPLRWRRPRLIFVNSMSDLFHPEVPTEFIARVVAVMAAASQHTFQVLTKRPKRMARLLSDARFQEEVHTLVMAATATRDGTAVTINWPMTWPLPNVWWGTSIESNRYAWRADALRDMPAAVRWVSAEPLLGPVDQLDLTGIDWVVAGGESGPAARPMHPDWVRDLLHYCLSGPGEKPIAFLFKQHGEWAPVDGRDMGHRRPGAYVEPDGSWRLAHEALPSPEAQHMRRVGKKAAGRELDGRTWDEYPVCWPGRRS